MKTEKIGGQTIRFARPASIVCGAATCGKMEGEGPLADSFDLIDKDTSFGEKNWERAESAMLRAAVDIAMQKAGIGFSGLDYIFGGDLLNQCIGSAFAVKDSAVPYFGLYGACSTMAEAMTLGAMVVDGGYAKTVCALTSSHFCSSERQFRTPLPYGCPRTPTAQRTATAAGAVILSGEGNGPFITCVTSGRILDAGIKDASNMGAAMAPAALDTLCTHFVETGRAPDYYDLVVTGDLGCVGSDILVELAMKKGFDLRERHRDCGMMIFDRKKQNVCAGGSGCGCGASVLAGYILSQMEKGEINRVLFAATGAIMSTTSAMQGESILGICHALSLENGR